MLNENKSLKFEKNNLLQEEPILLLNDNIHPKVLSLLKKKSSQANIKKKFSTESVISELNREEVNFCKCTEGVKSSNNMLLSPQKLKTIINKEKETEIKIEDEHNLKKKEKYSSTKNMNYLHYQSENFIFNSRKNFKNLTTKNKHQIFKSGEFCELCGGLLLEKITKENKIMKTELTYFH